MCHLYTVCFHEVVTPRTFDHVVDFGLNEHHLLGLILSDFTSLDETLGGTGNGVTLMTRQLRVVALHLEELVVVGLAQQSVTVCGEVVVTVGWGWLDGGRQERKNRCT